MAYPSQIEVRYARGGDPLTVQHSVSPVQQETYLDFASANTYGGGGDEASLTGSVSSLSASESSLFDDEITPQEIEAVCRFMDGNRDNHISFDELEHAFRAARRVEAHAKYEESYDALVRSLINSRRQTHRCVHRCDVEKACHRLGENTRPAA